MDLWLTFLWRPRRDFRWDKDLYIVIYWHIWILVIINCRTLPLALLVSWSDSGNGDVWRRYWSSFSCSPQVNFPLVTYHYMATYDNKLTIRSAWRHLTINNRWLLMHDVFWAIMWLIRPAGLHPQCLGRCWRWGVGWHVENVQYAPFTHSDGFVRSELCIFWTWGS